MHVSVNRSKRDCTHVFQKSACIVQYGPLESLMRTFAPPSLGPHGRTPAQGSWIRKWIRIEMAGMYFGWEAGQSAGSTCGVVSVGSL